jgi:hypothetical protein
MASPFTDNNSGNIVRPSALYNASRQLSSSGEFPAVCMTKEFVIAVSAGYFRSGTLFYRLGKVDGMKVEWQDENKIELDGRCSFPSVAATSEGIILLTYVKNKSTCHYVVGNLKRVGNQVEWSHSTLIDDGKNVSVSVHVGEGDILTALVAFVSGVNRGYTRVGVLEPRRKTIKWKCEKQEISRSSNFKEVSIAIGPSKDIVVAYRLTYTQLYCQMGKLTTASEHAFDDQCIEFHSEGSIDNLHGFHPSITINRQGHVMWIYQSIALRKIMLHTGIVQSTGLSGGIDWKDDGVADHIDYGCYPAVTLTDTGIFVEIHGTNLGTSLFYRVGKLELE